VTDNGAAVSMRTLVVYALPVLGINMLMSPAASLLPGIYATRYGISMASIGAVLLTVRVFDALIDPLVGIFADRTKARRGTRKPWIVAGAGISVLSGLFIYSPPEPVTSTTLFIGFLLLYLGWSTFEIPHNAWVAHLAPDYAGRSRAFSVRTVAFYLAGMLTFAVPLLTPGAEGQYSASVLLLTWGIAAAVLVIGTAMAVVRVPDPPSSVGVRSSAGFAAGWRAVIGNGSLRLFIAAYTLSGFGFGMALSLNYVYMQSVLGLSEKIPFIYVLSPAAILGVITWARVANRYSKGAVWACSTALAAAVFLAFLFVPRTPESFALVLCLNLALFFVFSGIALTAPAVLADVADYGRLRFGKDVGATYYAVFHLMVKASVGIAGGFGFALAGVFGFEAQLASHSPESIRGFMLAFSIVPAVLTVGALPFILAQPINRKRHAIIARALQRRANLAVPEGR